MISKSESEKLDEILLKLTRIEKALKIVPDRETTITDLDSSLKAYLEYALEELKLEEVTVNNHKSAILNYLNHSQGQIDRETVKAYLNSNESLSWKSNQVKALRRYIRDFLKLGNWIEEFEFEQPRSKRKSLPTNDQLIEFYNELPDQAQMIFLVLHNSGLRIGEVLSLKVSNIDFETHMIDASEIHEGKTKSSWLTFITQQTADLLLNYLSEDKLEYPDSRIFSLSSRSVQQAFKTASEKIGMQINPHLLRTVFAEKCRQAGIDKDYINAFCGRTPQSMLAKHYTDYSPEALRRQYDKVESYLTLG